MKSLGKLVSGVLVPLGIAAALFLALEGGCRAALRVKTGAWPETRVEGYTRFVEKIGKAFRRDPLLVVAGRENATLEAAGKTLHFNARGQRATNVRDLPLPKPPGVFRIVCAGGSTTLVVLAPDDAATWPARLGARLAPRADVANAGFTGWTSLESLVSLAVRDVDLSPDLVIVFSGVNDLQPAGHVPFTRDYSLGHLDLLPRVTGVERVPVRLVSRSVLLEFLLGRLRAPGAPAGAEGYAPAYAWTGPKQDDIPAAAVEVYERNLRSTIGVARAHGARTLLVAQQVRLRKGREAEDGAWISAWTPGLTTKGYLAGLARYNEVSRSLAARGEADFLDPLGDGSFPDSAFADPVHFSPEGSDLFAARLAAFLTAPGGPLAR